MNNRRFIIAITSLFASCSLAVISCVHGPIVSPTLSFNKDIIPIFTANCTINSNCHIGASSLNKEVDLDSAMAYHTLISRGLISTSNPSSSILYVEVLGTTSALMPKPPAAPLSAAQQNLILTWISQGALNN
jgi:hypothetical protein